VTCAHAATVGPEQGLVHRASGDMHQPSLSNAEASSPGPITSGSAPPRTTAALTISSGNGGRLATAFKDKLRA